MRGDVGHCAGSCLLVALVWPGQVASAEGGLGDLYDRYATLEQVVISASVQIEVFQADVRACCAIQVPANAAPARGALMYAADGQRWRLDSYLDPQVYPGMDTTLVFDGTDFAYFARNAGALGVRQGRPPALLGMVLPNPAFAPVEFLGALAEASAVNSVLLDDVRAAAAAADPSGVSWETVNFEGKMLERALFPGGIYGGVPCVHYVYAAPGAHDRPLVIDRVDEAGALLSRVRLSHWENVGPEVPSWWPRNVTMQEFDPAGAMVVEISFVMDVAVNDPQAIAPETFDIEALKTGANLVFVEGEFQQ